METKVKKILLIAVSFVLVLSACGTSKEAVLPRAVSAAEAYALYQNGAFFLDVRSQEEWDALRVENAALIPLEQLPDRLNELPKDETIVVICTAGGRSASGRDVLLEAGFTQVTSLSGGLDEWIASGYPVTLPP